MSEVKLYGKRSVAMAIAIFCNKNFTRDQSAKMFEEFLVSLPDVSLLDINTMCDVFYDHLGK